MPYFGAFKKTNNSLLDPMITRNGYGGPLVDAPGTARTIYYTFEAAKNGYSSLRPGTPTTLSSTEQAMVKKVFAQLSAAADVRFVQGARYISPLHKAQDQWGYVDQNKVAPAYDIALHGTANEVLLPADAAEIRRAVFDPRSFGGVEIRIAGS